MNFNQLIYTCIQRSMLLYSRTYSPAGDGSAKRVFDLQRDSWLVTFTIIIQQLNLKNLLVAVEFVADAGNKVEAILWSNETIFFDDDGHGIDVQHWPSGLTLMTTHWRWIQKTPTTKTIEITHITIVLYISMVHKEESLAIYETMVKYLNNTRVDDECSLKDVGQAQKHTVVYCSRS